MAQPYVGEIRMFAGNFAPVGWEMCRGQSLPISENETLFQLIGTAFGGDGQQTFALPDLQGRVPVHMGSVLGTNYVRGQAGGVESVTLTTQQLPIHTHAAQSASTGQVAAPGGAILADATSSQAGVRVYSNNPVPAVQLNAASIAPAGGNEPHENVQPTLGISFIISLFGIFPSPA